ncbi:MAG TPA: hypothetical protein VE080_02270 [Candidatus Aquicultoraceae bacterium]|nr:hypothetical protein [Candidatus Aquicultoraceae bacterium]
MRRKFGAAILATALGTMVALPPATTAGPAGRGGGSGANFRAVSRFHEPARMQEHLRLYDRYGIDPAGPGPRATEKRGFTHGPGDGTGNSGDRPLDGTGYGSPSNR